MIATSVLGETKVQTGWGPPGVVQRMRSRAGRPAWAARLRCGSLSACLPLESGQDREVTG